MSQRNRKNASVSPEIMNSIGLVACGHEFAYDSSVSS